MSARVLILDDFSSYLLFIKEVLIKEGFDIECAENEQDVQEILDTFHPDVILIDVYMHKRRGFKILEKLSRQHKFSKPIIVLSAGKNLEDIEKAFKLGAYDYLIKPLNLRDLQNKLQQAITKQLFKGRDGHE